jgi:hypothetical protein
LVAGTVLLRLFLLSGLITSRWAWFICITSGESTAEVWSPGSETTLQDVLDEAKELLSMLCGIENTLEVRDVRADEVSGGRAEGYRDSGVVGL